jgi:hypothetical protein
VTSALKGKLQGGVCLIVIGTEGIREHNPSIRDVPLHATNVQSGRTRAFAGRPLAGGLHLGAASYDRRPATTVIDRRARDRRRPIRSRRTRAKAGHRAALAQFVLRGLDRTQSGVLVYVSLAEHYIRMVPAEATSAAISHDEWQVVVDKALGPLAAGAIETALTGLADD